MRVGKKAPATSRRVERAARRAKGQRQVLPGWIKWVGAAVVAIAAIFAWQALNPAPEIVRPQDPESLSTQLVEHLKPYLRDAERRPRDPAVHDELGLIYEANALWPEAQASYANALALSGPRAEPMYHQALCALEAGDAVTGQARLEETVAAFPDFAPAAQRLGLLRLDAGELDAAVPLLERAHRLAPRAPAALTALADARLKQDNADAAVKLLQEALVIAPDDGTARTLLGNAYRSLGRMEDAQRELARSSGGGARTMVDDWSLRLPSHAKNLSRQMARAVAFMNAGRHAEAIAMYEESLRWNPDNPDVLNNLAIAHMNAGRLDEAEQYLQRSLQKNEGHHSTFANLSAINARRGRSAEALADVERAIAISPGVAQYHRARSSLLQRLQRWADALAAAQESVRLDPTNVQGQMMVGGSAAGLGRPEIARAAYETALRFAPSNVDAAIGLARACATLGDADCVATARARAMELAPTRADVLALSALAGG